MLYKLLFNHCPPQGFSVLAIVLEKIQFALEQLNFLMFKFRKKLCHLNNYIFILTNASFPFLSFSCLLRSYRLRIAATLVCLNWIASVTGVWPQRSLQSCLTCHMKLRKYVRDISSFNYFIWETSSLDGNKKLFDLANV